MAKVTSKLQVTVPRALALDLGIQPGDEIEWSSAAGAIRITPVKREKKLDAKRRLELFDHATKRQEARDKEYRRVIGRKASKRGWTREELYHRGRAG